MIFTRYLYNLDEVKYTFIECLLSKKPIEECYFWLYEYYISGFTKETWEIIWDVYYQFYALNYPRMIKKISSYYELYKKNKEFINILHVVKNFHRFSVDYKIFLSDVLYSKKLKFIFKNKDFDEEIEKYGYESPYEKLLIKSIKVNCYPSIAFYLNKNIDNPELNNLLKRVLNKTITINANYKNKFNQYMFYIMQNDNNGNYYYKREKQKKLQDILISNKSISPIKKERYEISQIYKTLKMHRKYSVSKNIGCFNLSRFNYNLKNMFWYHWEYFAYKSPLWKKRFNLYKIKVNHQQKVIEFLDEEEEEEFYEKYNYEPDEQSKETQEKSTLDINRSSFKKWIKMINA